MAGSRNSLRFAILCLTSCFPSHSRASLFNTASNKGKGSTVAWLGGLSHKLQHRQGQCTCIGQQRSTQSKQGRDKHDMDGVAVSAMRLKNDYSPVPFFKGWAKPGLEPPGISTGLVVEEGETLDAICGHFRIFQLDKGNKFTTDDHLAAWYATSWCPSAGKALDLGSGIGSVATIAAWRLRGTSFVTVEAQEISVRLARKSARFNGLESRFDIRLGDMRDDGILAEDEKFDLITGTPPYFPLEMGPEARPEHPQKLACRFETRGSVKDYCSTAARHLDMGGLFVLAFPIAPEWQENRVLEAAEAAGLAMVRIRPIVLREGDAPLLGLYGMMLKEHLPEELRSKTLREDPLIVRTKDGKLSLEFAWVRLASGMQPL